MPINLSPYFRCPEHIVRCAIDGCTKVGLRSEVCPFCREYHCLDHLKFPVQGDKLDFDNIFYLLNLDNINEITCLICGNSPPKLGKAKSNIQDQESLEKALIFLKDKIKEKPNRSQFALLLLDRFNELVQQIDLMESPLEEHLWAGLLVRGLDRYLDPQVEIYDYNGNYIVRADFASTLLRLAIFTDGHTFHDSPKQQAKDKEHNYKLQEIGWVIKRYWYEEVINNIDRCLEEIYVITCQRIAHMQDVGLPINQENLNNQ